MSVQPLQRPKRAPKVKQACDCCHARKIKCDGTSPCHNCRITVLECTYLSVHKKKGPKGPSKRTPRAILKMQMEQKSNAPGPSSVAPSDSSAPSSPPPELNNAYHYPGSRFEPSPLLTVSVAERFAESYFKYKYPLTPILHKGDFYAALPSFRCCPEQYALVASLCAAVLTQFNSDQQDSSPDPATAPLTTNFFISEARRARTARDYVEHPTLQDVQTSFFLFAGLFDRDRHNAAWFHLREAITLMEALRLHEEATYAAMPARRALFGRRTFWLLFVTERAYALQRHRPLSLDCSTVALPLPATDPADPDARVLDGFLDLIQLFRYFTPDFVATWNAAARPFPAHRPQPNVDPAHLAALQDTLACVEPATATRSEVQQADLVITRLWLSTMTWQLCVSHGFLSSRPRTSPALTFHYPIALSARLAAVCAPLRREAVDANGPGILEKIFDVGCALVDVLGLRRAPAQVDAMHVGPREYLAEMLRVMAMAMGGSSRFLVLLGERAEEAMRTGVPPGMALALRTAAGVAVAGAASPPRPRPSRAVEGKEEEDDGGLAAHGYGTAGMCDGDAWIGGVDAVAGPREGGYRE